LVAESRQISPLLDRLSASLASLAAEVAIDLGGDMSEAATRPIVEHLLTALRSGPRLGPAALRRLRSEGAQAATEGRPLAAPIDAYLSSTWVIWDHAVAIARPGEAGELASLGSRLLRAGDDVAAALADGYTAAERALARSAGAATQAVLDELLTAAPRDAPALARMARRASLVGLDPAATYHVLVVRGPDELTVESPLVAEVARRLARDSRRRPHLALARGGDLVAIMGGSNPGSEPFTGLTRDLTGWSDWWAVSAGPATLEDLASANAAALDALRVVTTVAEPRTLTSADALALERALVADPALAAEGARRWLDPLESAGRGSTELLPTLEAWLSSGQSVVATARVLGVAPRTVSYRLERIARLFGERDMGGKLRERLTVALLVRRLLAAT
jgi:hypothetical protein